MKNLFTITLLIQISISYSQQWEMLPITTQQGLNSVHFPSRSIGYIVGNYGTMFKTIDSGNTWNDITYMDTTLESVYFINDAFGIAVGDNGIIIKTTDGGNTWVEKHNNSQHNFRDIHSMGNGIWLVAGDYSAEPFIMKSVDDGETWSVKPTNHVPYEYHRLYSIDFVNNTTGYAVGYNFKNGVDNGYILKSTDGGETWNEQSWGKIEVGFRSVHFTNQTTGYIAGGGYYINGVQHLLIFKTIDSGVSWDSTTFVTNQGSNEIFFTSKDTGYIAGDWGGVSKTIDGGQSWEVTKIDGFSWSNSIWMTGYETGITVGYGGKIAKATLFVATGIEEVESKNIQLYPNPSNGKFKIELSGNKNGIIEIFNSLGSVVYRIKNESSNEIIIQLPLYLDNGLYFVKFRNNESILTQKLLLQRE